MDKVPVMWKILSYPIGLIFDYGFDLGPSRNRYMAQSLDTRLRSDAEITEIIVLTGSHHTRPISKILKKKYGFIEKSFR